MKIVNLILNFLNNPKNTRLLIFGLFLVLILILLGQCNKNKYLKSEIEKEKKETQRIKNNYEASKDTIKTYKIDENTWRSEKLGYELKLEELNGEYSHLLGKFKIEKNKPPKVIVKTEYIIQEKIVGVPVLVKIDESGNEYLAFYDSVFHNKSNFRILSGKIPYYISFDDKDSSYNMAPGNGDFNLEIGMNLNLGVFQDKNTRKIFIKVDTDYPGISFTTIEGASIIDDPKNKDIIRGLRKPWGIGFSVGYGAMINPSSGIMTTGPYFGIGINYTPKFLQFGK